MSRTRLDGLTNSDALSTQKLRDRDAFYLGVKTSEERRKRKGLPPRVFILLDWGMSDGDLYVETKAKRRAKANSKSRRAQAKGKGVRQ